MKMTRTLFYGALSLACLATGCAAPAPPTPSGFLDDYARLSKDINDESLLWWEREGFDWRRFDKVMIDPFVLYFHADSKGSEIRPDELNKLTAQCRAAIVEELGDEYPVVDSPGSGVLRIRAAVTDVIPANVGLNVLTTAVAFVPLDMGGASIEVAFIDSQSNRLMATGIDQKLGVPTQLQKGFTSLGHARQACNEWAKELHTALKTNP